MRGQTKVTVEREDRQIVSAAVTAPVSSLSTIHCVACIYVSNVNAGTWLRERNLCYQRPMWSLSLTPEHRWVRLECIRSQLTWNYDDRGHIGFSGEDHILLCTQPCLEASWAIGRACSDSCMPHRPIAKRYCLMCHLLWLPYSSGVTSFTMTTILWRHSTTSYIIVSFFFLLTFQHSNGQRPTIHVVMNCVQACSALLWWVSSPHLFSMKLIWDLIRRLSWLFRNIDDLL